MLRLPPMRIALVSTPFVPVPPPAYGGTELVVAELADGLREAGHEVRVYTCGAALPPSSERGDAPGLERRVLFERPVWPPGPWLELAHSAWAALDLARADPPFDLVHTHCPSSLPLAPLARSPMVYTVHHARDGELAALYRLSEGVHFVCVSARQRALLPEVAGRACVIHHGLDERRYALGDGRGPALFLGRLSAQKGPHLAIDAARRAGCPLVLAGRPHPEDRDYFESEVRPRLSLPGVRWIGEVDHARKLPLLAAARALLFPVCWEEPFGLVMIEAMLSGTPVLALPRGAVPEVVDDGITGYVCADEDELAQRLGRLERGGLDRARCRQHAVLRFSRRRLVREHLALYRGLVGAGAGLALLAPQP